MGARGRPEEFDQYIPCPSNNEGCKYFPECDSNTDHHKSPRRLLKQLAADVAIGAASPELYAVAKEYTNHRKNQIRCCRAIHDLLDRMVPDALPPQEEMQAWIDKNKEPKSESS